MEAKDCENVSDLRDWAKERGHIGDDDKLTITVVRALAWLRREEIELRAIGGPMVKMVVFALSAIERPTMRP